jgi:hypothetical protein
VCCLELFLLIGMCRYLMRTATAKGHTGWPFAVLMVIAWFIVGIVGGVVGYFAEGAPSSDYSVGAFCGYVVGAAIACGGMALLVNSLTDHSTAHEQAAIQDEQAYIQWRKRHAAKKAKFADEEEEPVVDLQPADAPPPPRAARAWKRRDWDA